MFLFKVLFILQTNLNPVKREQSYSKNKHDLKTFFLSFTDYTEVLYLDLEEQNGQAKTL